MTLKTLGFWQVPNSLNPFCVLVPRISREALIETNWCFVCFYFCFLPNYLLAYIQNISSLEIKICSQENSIFALTEVKTKTHFKNYILLVFLIFIVESVAGKLQVGLGLPVAVSNNEGRVETCLAFIEKASQPRRQGACKHQILSSSKVQGTGLYRGRG